MELISHITTIGIIATIFMTAFSYAISYFTKSKFEEPQLLNILLDRLKVVNFKIANEHIIGWVLHIAIGIFLVAIFIVFQNIFKFEINLLSGLIFGFLAGLGGIFVWFLSFHFHPNPPNISYKQFYTQLLIAHIIFGICTITLV